MADVRPFKGIRYNPAKVKDLSQVITQPYDKITPEMQRAYYKKSAQSFVRLILADAADPYAESRKTVDAWLADSTLIRDPKPAFYVIHQEFEVNGEKKLRKGFIGAVRVEKFEKGVILPHERTLSKPKADRLNLTRATRKDYEQIFLLYSDPEGAVDKALAAEGKPMMEATDDYGVTQRIWAVTDPTKIAAVEQALKHRPMLIADGHHRYETALNYGQEIEAEGAVPFDAALRFKTTAFINIADPGLVILPTHRLLYGLPKIDWAETAKKLARWFTMYRVTDELLAEEVAKSFWLGEHVFGLYAGKGESYVLRLADKRAMEFFVKDRSKDYRGLDAAILHTLIIDQVFGVPAEKIEDHVAYERKAAETLAKVDSSKFQVGLLMNPTRAEQVNEVAAHAERMPQKSTDFYPKLVSGLVFMDVAETERL